MVLKIEELISKGEEIADKIYIKTKLYLPFIARLCLLSTFIQENLIIASQWDELAELLTSREFDKFITGVMTTVCFLLVTLGIVMVLLHKVVQFACGLLFASSLLQMWITSSIPDICTFLINGSILGSMFIILAESKGETSSLFAGIPTLDSNKPKDYLKLSGRCLLIFMFINFTSLKPSFFLVLQDVLGCVLMFLVVLGYKTKLSVLATIVYLNSINCYMNSWWTISNAYYREYVRYRFCQVVSVTGGLLMIVLYGPGRISFDEAKKRL